MRGPKSPRPPRRLCRCSQALRAIIARPLGEVQRLATSDKQIYATYHQLTDAGVRVPEGDKWDVLRSTVGPAIFPDYHQHIRFAALSLGTLGSNVMADRSEVDSVRSFAVPVRPGPQLT